MHLTKRSQYRILFLSSVRQFWFLLSNYQLWLNLIKILDSFPVLNYNLLFPFPESHETLTLPLRVGTSKQVQVFLGKSPPAALPDPGLIALINFFFSLHNSLLSQGLWGDLTFTLNCGSFSHLYYPFKKYPLSLFTQLFFKFTQKTAENKRDPLPTHAPWLLCILPEKHDAEPLIKTGYSDFLNYQRWYLTLGFSHGSFCLPF